MNWEKSGSADYAYTQKKKKKKSFSWIGKKLRSAARATFKNPKISLLLAEAAIEVFYKKRCS